MQELELGHSGDGCKHAQAKKLGDVTTVNLTMLRAGVSLDGGKTFSLNVIPTAAEAGLDCRIPLTMPFSGECARGVGVASMRASERGRLWWAGWRVDGWACADVELSVILLVSARVRAEMRSLLDGWCASAGSGVSWKFAPWTAPLEDHFSTSVSREESPWWARFQDASAELGMSLETAVFPASTDSRFVRQLGTLIVFGLLFSTSLWALNPLLRGCSLFDCRHSGVWFFTDEPQPHSFARTRRVLR